MQDRKKMITLIEYHIHHNLEHSEELAELAVTVQKSGIDSGGIIVASELMKKSVEALGSVLASLQQ